MQTENELRRQISRSRQAGFRMLFEQYRSYVYTIVWNRISAVGTKENAEECVSDVFAELFLHYDEIREGSLHGFIGTLAKRKAIRAFHRLSGSVPAESLDREDAPELPSAEDIPLDLEQQEQQMRLFRAVRSLGEPDARIVMMRYYYDCTSAEIGRRVGLNPIAVRVRLNRALKKLRQCLADEDIRL